MFVTNRWTLFWFLFLIIVLVFSNVAPVVEGQKPRYGGTIVVGVPTADPGAFNPFLSDSPTTHIPAAPMYSSLIALRTDNFNVIPELAESWEVSKDELTWTFHLVRNATWHDGRRVTSADVKFTIELQKEKGYHSKAKSLFEAIAGIETPNDFTVVFKLANPAPLAYYLVEETGTIIPKHIYEGTDPLKNPDRLKPVGSGPFIFNEYIPGERLVLVRNPNYFKALPYLDKIVFRWIRDPASMSRAYEAGEVDVIVLASTPIALELAKRHDSQLIVTQQNQVADYVALNLRHPILSNVKVRQAIAHAINLQFIIDVAFRGLGKPADSLFPAQVSWYAKDAPRYNYDPAKAEKLLDEAGYLRKGDGSRFELRMMYDRAREDKTLPAAVILENLRAVGIKVVDRPETTVVLNELYLDKWDFDLVLVGAGTFPSPWGVFDRLHPDNIIKGKELNFVGYTNPEVKRILDEARAAEKTSLQQRDEKLQGATKIIMTDLPWIPFRHRHGFNVVSKTIFVNSYESVMTRERFYGWWSDGHSHSPRVVNDVIAKAESVTSDLKAKGFDVSQPTESLNRARTLLSNLNYDGAFEAALASTNVATVTVTKPEKEIVQVVPTWVYGMAGTLIVATAISVVYAVRRRR